MTIDEKIQIIPLNEKYLDTALVSLNKNFRSFPGEKDRPELELGESVSPGRYLEQLAEYGIIKPQYWAAIREESFLGLTGIFFNPEDMDEAVWGGYTFVNPEIKSSLSIIKIILLSKLVSESNKTQKKYLRLYTETFEEEIQANKLYSRVLSTYKTVNIPGSNYIILFREALMTDVLKIMSVYLDLTKNICC